MDTETHVVNYATLSQIHSSARNRILGHINDKEGFVNTAWTTVPNGDWRGTNCGNRISPYDDNYHPNGQHCGFIMCDFSVWLRAFSETKCGNFFTEPIGGPLTRNPKLNQLSYYGNRPSSWPQWSFKRLFTSPDLLHDSFLILCYLECQTLHDEEYWYLSYAVYDPGDIIEAGTLPKRDIVALALDKSLHENYCYERCRETADLHTYTHHTTSWGLPLDLTYFVTYLLAYTVSSAEGWYATFREQYRTLSKHLPGDLVSHILITVYRDRLYELYSRSFEGDCAVSYRSGLHLPEDYYHLNQMNISLSRNIDCTLLEYTIEQENARVGGNKYSGNVSIWGCGKDVIIALPDNTVQIHHDVEDLYTLTCKEYWDLDM
jgi:hypothetical protein